MDNWLSNIGRVQLSPDPPHGINGQCVNAASSWSMAQGGPELFGIGDSSTAWTIWETFNHPFYQRVTGGFQPGDILFYSPNNPAVGTGGAGHVDVYVGGSTTADADWNGDPNLQEINLNLATKAAGAFRPQGEQQMIIGSGDNWYDRCNKTHQMTRGRELDRDTFNGFVGQDFLHFVEACEDDPEADATQNAQTVGVVAVRDNWQGQINDLTAKNAQLSELNQALKTQVLQDQDKITQLQTTTAPVAQPSVASASSDNSIVITKDGLWTKVKGFLTRFFGI